MMRVFISSTSYDLLDLRAELEVFFKNAGVEPVMSDSLTSDFQVSPERNSIETCLANVRTCDHFIVILSNRYGPTLEKAGYKLVSATHLEYLEARENNIPVHMYVRDRLEADYAIWKSNADKSKLNLVWCKSQKDWKIFELIEAHRNLTDAGGNNWFWIFRNSIELKDRIARDFKDAFALSAVRALFDAGNLPLLEVVQGKTPKYDDESILFSLRVRNVGGGTAVSPQFQVVNSANQWQLTTLYPKEETEIQIRWRLQVGCKTNLEIQLTYSTLQGHKFVDEASLLLWDKCGVIEGFEISYALNCRRYLGETDAALLKMPTFDGTNS